ncbi:S-layer homology domain-containing protein [Thermanaeromonas sp. C210]|uniref:S-layer homology domain-containing protein n=1 Tax=Thermanaeromonas sp. C210 TaxID=2731925 RepID=UPI00155D31CB|nr:S-layer homology domain-containing protein [Thermanaeromonas sp. C210]GFN23253.1 hypothetical protein TAMC210_15700 [Thermanaeromonas sp. C210]
MLRRNSGIVFVSFLLWSACLLAAQDGGDAAAEVVYAVYNESRGTYFSDLQAALDAAQKGDALRVVAGGATFNVGLSWRTDGITLDLNGATVTAPQEQNAITVAETVTNLELRNGILKTSDLATNGIEVLGGASSPLEIKLENMEIYGKQAVYIKRNAQLECSGGKVSGSSYGVLVDPSVEDFKALFKGVTFERSSTGALYFSGSSNNRPVTEFSLEACRFGKEGNPLAGSVLWVEAGTTTVEMNACTVEAGGNTRDLVHVKAAGGVTVAHSRFYRARGSAVSLTGVTEGLLAGNEIITRAGYQDEDTSYSPALRIESSQCVIRANRLTGPGVQGIRVIRGRVELEGNYIAGFADGAYLEQGELEAISNIITAYERGIALRDTVGGRLQGNELTGPQDSERGTGVFIQGGASLDLVDNVFQGWSTGLLVDGNGGIRVAGNAFRDNGVGARLSAATGAVLESSLWEGNDTGLVVSGEVEADIHDNVITANGIGVDLGCVTGDRLQFSRNDLYGNTVGVQAPSVITVEAPHNYWGSSSGPRHELLNPQGRGEKVTGNLNFTPWSPYAHGEDDLPPRVDLFLPAGLWRENASVPLEISVEEETLLDRVNLWVYGPQGEENDGRSWWADEWGAQARPIAWDTGDLEDGSYCFEVSAVDGKGNVGRAEGCLLLDRHPPSHPWIYINGGQEETPSLTVQLTLGAEDAGGIAEMMLRNEGDTLGEWEPYRPVRVWELSPGPAGLRQVIARFRDRAGWVSEEVMASILFNPGVAGSEEPGQKEEMDRPEEVDLSEDHEKGKGSLPGRDASPRDTLEEGDVEDREGEVVGEGRDAMDLDFSDVPEGHWARLDILALTSRGLFQEVERGRFFPEKPLARGELAALLDRVLMLPPGPQGDWRDVPPDSPYEGAVARVAGSGLMVGYEDGSFRPGSPVSRQEAVAVLVRTARKIGINPGGSQGAKAFMDLEEVAPWAYRDVFWATTAGLLRGYPDGSFRPRRPLTRAEAAALLRRFLDLTFPAEQGFDMGKVPGRLLGP